MDFLYCLRLVIGFNVFVVGLLIMFVSIILFYFFLFLIFGGNVLRYFVMYLKDY